METRKFEALKPAPGLLGMGCMRLPTRGDGSVHYAESERLIDALYAAGVTYYDTAWVYHDGLSEDFVRRALVERYPRESFQIADKFPVWETQSAEDCPRIFEEQLRRLGVSCIDFYLLHSLGGRNWETCKQYGVYEYQCALKKQGRIRYQGFSFHGTTGELRKILDEAQFDFVQLQVNYYDWADYAREQYELCVSRGLTVIVMEPVRGGTLSRLTPEVNAILRTAEPEQSPSQLALRWAGSLDGVYVVLSGMSAMAHAEENLAAFSPFVPLTGAQKRIMAAAREKILERPTIPCTGCNYCYECPAGVRIPGVFDAYNEYARFDSHASARWRYLFELTEAQRAHNCIECGACSAICPQSIDIPQELIRVDARFREIGIVT